MEIKLPTPKWFEKKLQKAAKDYQTKLDANDIQHQVERFIERNIDDKILNILGLEKDHFDRGLRLKDKKSPLSEAVEGMIEKHFAQRLEEMVQAELKKNEKNIEKAVQRKINEDIGYRIQRKADYELSKFFEQNFSVKLCEEVTKQLEEDEKEKEEEKSSPEWAKR